MKEWKIYIFTVVIWIGITYKIMPENFGEFMITWGIGMIIIQILFDVLKRSIGSEKKKEMKE